MIRQEQCDKVCRILDDVLANRPTERDSLNVAVRKAFDALEQPETNCSEIPNNSDTISRQAAIDEIHEDAEWLASQGSDWQVERMERDKSILMSLPSVQPEPRTAYWTKDIVGSVICSNCGGIREDNRIGHTQWCNCCGCFMRGE